MHAQVGDHLRVEGHTTGAPRRDGSIVEVHGKDGGPPYVVRWSDGHVAEFYPGPDAHIVPPDAADVAG